MKIISTSTFLFSFFLISCSSSQKHHDGHSASSPVYFAVAVMQPVAPHNVSGQIYFTERFGEVRVEGRVKGLPALSEHGFHIHEYGDCRSAGATSAGGHYNPHQKPHGGPQSEARHAGDFGNIKSDKNGEAVIKLNVKDLSLMGGVNPIVGRGVIIHLNPDDLISQPTGGAGDRISCGVIGIVQKLAL